jgi:hypothetical protein
MESTKDQLTKMFIESKFQMNQSFDKREHSILENTRTYIQQSIESSIGELKDNSVAMINSEMVVATKAVKEWVEERLSDSAKLLKVPGVIGDGDDKQKKCEFKTFSDFVKQIQRRYTKEKQSFATVHTELDGFKAALEQIPNLENRLVEYVKE